MKSYLKYFLFLSVSMALTGCGGDDNSTSIANSSNNTTSPETDIPKTDNPKTDIPTISSSNFYTGTATLLSTSGDFESLAYLSNDGYFWSVQRVLEKNSLGNNLSSFTWGKLYDNEQSLGEFYDQQNYGMQVTYNATIKNKDNKLIIKSKEINKADEKVVYTLQPNDKLQLSDLNGLIGHYNGEITDMIAGYDYNIPDSIKDSSANMSYPANLDIKATNNLNELSFKLTIPYTQCFYTGTIKPYSSEERYFFKLDADLQNCPSSLDLYEPIQSITGNVIKDKQGIVLTGYTERGVVHVPDATAQGSFLFIEQ